MYGIAAISLTQCSKSGTWQLSCLLYFSLVPHMMKSFLRELKLPTIIFRSFLWKEMRKSPAVVLWYVHKRKSAPDCQLFDSICLSMISFLPCSGLMKRKKYFGTFQSADDPSVGEEQPCVREQGLHAALLLGPPQEGLSQGGLRSFSGLPSGILDFRAGWQQCGGTGTVEAVTFCRSGTETVINYDSGTVVKWNHKSSHRHSITLCIWFPSFNIFCQWNFTIRLIKLTHFFLVKKPTM